MNLPKHKQLIAGLTILSMGGEPYIDAQHDVIYATGKVSDEEAKLMELYGWHYDDTHQTWAIHV